MDTYLLVSPTSAQPWDKVEKPSVNPNIGQRGNSVFMCFPFKGEEKTIQFTEQDHSTVDAWKNGEPQDPPLGTQAEHSNCGRSRRIEFLNDWRLLDSPHYQTTMKLLCGFCWLNHVNPIPYTIPYSSNVTTVILCGTTKGHPKNKMVHGLATCPPISLIQSHLGSVHGSKTWNP